NQLTAVPPEIVQLTKLQTLSLSANQLTAVPPEIVQLTNLQSLDLSSNQLTAVPPEISQLTNLQTLYLYGNKLTAVPPEIVQLTNLQTLELYNNQLTAVPPEIGQLTNLTRLDISGNQIEELPMWLVQMPKLEKLYIQRNPITQPPPELFGKTLTAYGPDKFIDLGAVRRYYAQLAEEGQAYFYEAKLLLIGEGGAGKTSLARKLLNPAANLPQEEESTTGIDVMQWEFPLSVTGNQLSVSGDPSQIVNRKSSIENPRRYTANIWDFGGQSIYHATHQFFLSKRSVYILLADTRREHTDFYDWLQMQEAFAADSPILLLKNQNRTHGNECVIENLPHLQK
ncbi:MAG: hypothetical protein GY803_16590, partial [Chloroflexi bacterium]|nr:hypothetical protein [Chloroflexota bacterium]